MIFEKEKNILANLAEGIRYFKQDDQRYRYL